MSPFRIVAEQIAIFAVYAMVGVIAVKTKIITRDGLQVLSRLITKIILPLLVFSNTVNGTSISDFRYALPLLGAAVILYLLIAAVTSLLGVILRLPKEHKPVYLAGALFGNVGFMGLPVIMALFPENGALYVALFMILDQFLLWTLGADLLTSQEKKASMSLSQRLKKMINPVTVAVVLALLFVVMGWQLPEFLSTAVTKTGSAATPLALLYLGGIFAFSDIRRYAKRVEFYVLAMVKMLLLSALLIFVYRQLPMLSEEMAVTMGILCALPCMSSIAMIAETQGSDVDYSAGMVFITTICSVITLPLVCLV